MNLDSGKDKTLVIIPARNEEGAIQTVIGQVHAAVPDADVLVIDDCSVDNTRQFAEEAGARVLPVPHHLGLGGVVQAGYKLAYELGYSYVARVDGDGQHNPLDIPRLLSVLRTNQCQMVIGSRFVEGGGGGYSSFTRGLGIHLFRWILRPILGKPVHDPTSGFVAVNREALEVFSHSFPLDYPEIEALVVLQRKRFRFEEVPCTFRERMAGVSTITPLKSVRFVVFVLLGVFVNVIRRYSR